MTGPEPNVDDTTAQGSAPMGSPLLHARGIFLDPAAMRVVVNGSPMPLPLREFELLRYFLMHPNVVLTGETLGLGAWGPVGAAAVPYIRIQVRRLRARLARHGGPRDCIRTIRNHGYVFEGRDTDTDRERVGGPMVHETFSMGAPSLTVSRTNLRFLSVSGVDLNLDGLQLRVGERKAELTLGEFQFLRVLMERAGEVLSAEHIAEEAFGRVDAHNKLIAAYVRRARRHLAAVGAPTELLRTVRGAGYVFDAL